MMLWRCRKCDNVVETLEPTKCKKYPFCDECLKCAKCGGMILPFYADPQEAYLLLKFYTERECCV